MFFFFILRVTVPRNQPNVLKFLCCINGCFCHNVLDKSETKRSYCCFFLYNFLGKLLLMINHEGSKIKHYIKVVISLLLPLSDNVRLNVFDITIIIQFNSAKESEWVFPCRL